MFALLGSILLLVATVVATPPRAPFNPNCLVGQPDTYDASQSSKVRWYSVNLDADPVDRFKRIASDHANQIREGVDVIRRMLDGIFGPIAMELVEHLMDIAHQTRLAQPYKDEITGMSQVSGISAAHLTMMNMFYELSRFCTSIIAQSPTGQMFHARNLDFGQLFWWNTTSHSWGMTDKLKPLTVNLMFLKKNRLLYKGTGFAGHVGVITAMKPNAFTLSMNAREHPDIGNLFQWFMGNFANAHFAMWLDREVMEQANTYEEARAFIKSAPLMAGSYYILGGTQPGQGTVITRDPSNVVNERFLDSNSTNGWFLLQTNYDPGENTIFLDDRRGPGTACMIKLGQGGVSASGLFQVLNSKTTLNKTTVHTVIMSITTGLYQTFVQYCSDPCWFL